MRTPLALAASLLAPSLAPAQVTEIIDASDGLDGPDFQSVAVDTSGNVFVTGFSSSNAFKITPGGTVTEIIGPAGDGGGNPLSTARGVAADSLGNVYVAGDSSDNLFKIEPGGTITEIIDSTGAGGGVVLDGAGGVAVDASDNVFVTGMNSDNVLKVTPGGTITQIISATGDGLGNVLDWPRGIAVGPSGNVYVIGTSSDNVFEITPTGTITEIFDATGDGVHALDTPRAVATDPAGNVFVAGGTSDNVLKRTPGGAKSQILDATGAGGADILNSPFGLATDSIGNVFVVGLSSRNVFKITPGGTIIEIIDSTAGGAGSLDLPTGIAVGGTDVFVSALLSDNAFRIANVAGPAECALLLGTTPASAPLGGDDVLLVDRIIAGWEVTIPTVPTLLVPNDQRLLGLQLYFQVLMFDPAVDPSDPLRLSNGLKVTIGGPASRYGSGSGIDLWAPMPAALGEPFRPAFRIAP